MMNRNKKILESRQSLMKNLCDIYNKHTKTAIEDEALYTFLKKFHEEMVALNDCQKRFDKIETFLSGVTTDNQTIKEIIQASSARITGEIFTHQFQMTQEKTKIKNYSLYGTIVPSIPSVIGLILYFTTPLGIATLIAAGGAVGVLILGQAIYWACMASCYVDLTKKIADPNYQPTLGEGKALSEDALPKAPVKYVKPRVSLQSENSTKPAEAITITSAISALQQTPQFQAFKASVEDKLPGVVEVATEVSQNTVQLVKDGWSSGLILFNQAKQLLTEPVDASRSEHSSSLYQRLLK